MAWYHELSSQCSGKNLKSLGDCCHVESSQIERYPMKIHGLEREPLKFWEIVEVYFCLNMICFVWSTYAMKSLPCKFDIFRGSFAISKWYTAFSLHLMQEIQIWTTSTQIIVQKWLQKSLLRSSPHVDSLCKKKGRAICENLLWKPCKNGLFRFWK